MTNLLQNCSIGKSAFFVWLLSVNFVCEFNPLRDIQTFGKQIRRVDSVNLPLSHCASSCGFAHWMTAHANCGAMCKWNTRHIHSGLARVIHGVISVRWYVRDHLCMDDLCRWSMRDHPGRWSMRNDFGGIIYHRWQTPFTDHLCPDDLSQMMSQRWYVPRWSLTDATS